MKRLLVRRSVVGLTLGALAGVGLTSVSSPAQAAVLNASVNADAGTHDHASCTAATVDGTPADVPWSDNSVPVSNNATANGTVTGAPGDVTPLTGTGAATVTASPIGTGAATITVVGAATATAKPVLPGSACQGHAWGAGGADAEFALSQPMWATITVSSTGRAATAGFELRLGLDDGSIDIEGNNRTNGSFNALIPVGNVNLETDFWADAYGDVPAQRDVALSATIKIELQPLGAGSAVAGKGGGYTQFGARDCATGNVAAAITKKAKKKAKQVLITVNGAKVAKLKGKKLKKRTLVLPAAPASAAEVVATITLKNGKKVTVTRSYLACS